MRYNKHPASIVAMPDKAAVELDETALLVRLTWAGADDVAAHLGTSKPSGGG